MLRSSRVQLFGKMFTISGKKSYTSFISSTTSVGLNIVPFKVTTRNFNIANHFAHRRALVVATYQSRFFSSYPSHIVVPMPALSPTMELGSISSWHLKEGDKFSPGQAICEVETDKAVVTYEATDEGYIAKILVGKGEIKVGEPMMITVAEPDDVPSFAAYSLTTTASAPLPPSAPATPATTAAPALAVAPPQATSAAVASSTPAMSGGRILASPLAKKVAKESSLDLSSIFPGSGPNGRIIKEDVLQAVKNPPTVKVSPPVAATSTIPTPAVTLPSSPTTSIPPSKIDGIYEDFVLAPLADALATRFTVSKQTVPHYYLSTELNVTNLLALRSQFNAVAGKGEIEIGVLDMLLRGAALALKQVPDANASWNDAGFVRRFDQIDINVVIGDSNSKGGMSLPLLKDVGSKGFKTIANEVAKFQTADTSTSTELVIGTFTVHNLGMFGIKSAAPIVLPPQACALGLGAIVESVIPKGSGKGKDGEEVWTVAPVIVATLSCDHRVIDGAVGAQWLSAFKALVETPTNMLL